MSSVTRRDRETAEAYKLFAKQAFTVCFDGKEPAYDAEHNLVTNNKLAIIGVIS